MYSFKMPGGATAAACPHQVHYSFYSTRPVFDNAYAAAPLSTSTVKNIKGITVTHHLLAANLIAGMFDQVATTAPITVVLISPNHFSAGNGEVITSAYDWQTPYGIVPVNCKAVQDLVKTGLISDEEDPFVKEHGISGIVPFIKKSLPNASVVPIIVKDTLSETGRQQVAEALYKEFGDTVLVVASFDFSHYLPSQEADFHDAKTLSVLQDFDYGSMSSLDTDSAPGVEVSLRLLQKMGATRFDVSDHTNSAKFLHDVSIEQTTSYIDGTFTVAPPIQNHTATIVAFGDMMLDRGIRLDIQKKGPFYPFEHIERFLLGSDVVVANAEGAFTQFPSQSVNDFNLLTFTFDPAELPILKDLGFTLLSQANNHALNFGAAGLQESQAAIRASGMETFGDPTNDEPGPFYETIRGIRVAFVGYHQFLGTDAKVIEAIRSAKAQGAFVIVYPHWGIEYSPTMTPFQQSEAHGFIDAGADLILGAHPHVIEPIEIYKGKAIFYSMGNFIFDQSNTGPTSEGLSVGVVITPDQVSYSLFPLTIQGGQASLMPYGSRVTLLSGTAQTALISGSGVTRAEIASGFFTLPR